MAAPDASAGTYSAPVYSGGTWKQTDPPYNSSSGSYYPYGNSYGASLDDKPTNGSLICQGTVTAVFTWQPAYTGDLPPASVIVEQTSGASCTTTASPGVTAQASDGLNDPQTGSWYSSGTHYMVIPGTQTITLNKCSPMASITTTQKHEIMAGVGYTAAVYAPTITPNGAILGGSGYNILVGQSCTGILSGIPSALLSNTISPPTYQWGVTGTTFQSWTVSADQSHTTEVDGPGRSDQPTAQWFWNDNLGTGGNKVEQVTCTVTVTPPAGQGSAITVTASQPVTVWVPVWSGSGTGDGMYVVNRNPSGSPDFWVEAYKNPSSGDEGGMNWMASVHSPLTSAFSDGTLNMVQLVIPGNSFVAEGVHYHVSNNGEEGLDTNYPAPNENTGNIFASHDDPGIDLSNTVAGTAAYSAVTQNQFEDFLLFTPPGSSQCVPVAQFVWSTDGNVTETYRGNIHDWAYFGSGSAGSLTNTGVSYFVQTNAFPMWTQNSGNGSYNWVTG